MGAEVRFYLTGLHRPEAEQRPDQPVVPAQRPLVDIENELAIRVGQGSTCPEPLASARLQRRLH
ncbi:hypothetical protein [Candidatus Amarolinea dominans]|uniref:hypothetical protein n=1 Tax=Candidatus Amarolinea dominans TaxID=3140696 RepID=UPI003136C073|nr:hypothetical protein [Anaerolineae bacterium]